MAGATQAEVDELFYAQQNARAAQNAEVYYRSMFHGRDESWNLRDIHMTDTLRALQEHLPAERRPARIIGHTTRISGTPERLKWGEREQINLGQLVREQAKDDCLLLTLTAAP